MRMLPLTTALFISLVALTPAASGHVTPRAPQPEAWTMGVETAAALFDAALPPGARTATRLGLAALGSAAESATAEPQRAAANAWQAAAERLVEAGVLPSVLAGPCLHALAR